MKIPLSVKNQSVETSGITKDFGEALCEFIWNGFEANATTVIISYIPNVLNGIDTITISDNGDGISFDNLSDTFGAFLASQKNSYSLKAKTKANKGKGRFSFSAFSSMAKWNTVYKDNDEFKSFSITLTDANKEEVEFEEPKVIYDRKITGTEVSFFNISKSIYSSDISLEALEYCFLKEFAWFLYLNKHKSVKIILNDQKIDYSKYIDDNFSSTISKRINEFDFKINLIVWNERIKERFRSYYFDSNDTLKGSDNTSFNNTFNNTYEIYSPAKAEPNIPYKEIVEHLNIRTGSSYKHTTKKTKELIKARYNEGFTLDNFKEVIDKKCVEWMNSDMEKYLRPETLFGTKFEGYLNQVVQQKKVTTKDIPIDISDF